MATVRVRRQINRLLDDAEEAISQHEGHGIYAVALVFLSLHIGWLRLDHILDPSAMSQALSIPDRSHCNYGVSWLQVTIR